MCACVQFCGCSQLPVPENLFGQGAWKQKHPFYVTGDDKSIIFLEFDLA